ncbi:MAG: hypothetical protein JOZ64_16125 [Solirubrobacterales bacterium]|nr:hypothetical protein [Solirubrobacterales bacterium]
MPPSSARRSAIESYEARILAYERGLAPAPARPPSSPAAGARRRPSFTRLRRILVFAWLLLAADVALSFGGAMLRPSNTGFSIRAVEWLRDNGAAGLVSDVEAIFYSLSAPSTGGTALKALPQVGVGAAAPDRAGAASPSASASASAAGPAPIAPVISPALPGEGRWRGTGPLVRGAPPVMVTTFRPDPNYPRMVAGVAWIDSSRAWVQLYPGRYEPPGAGGTPAEVPPPLRGELLATFNSGFKLADSGAGFVAFGHVYVPLKQDQATFLRYRDGTADIRMWTGGPSPGPGVEFARQNLPLLVQGDG